MAKASGCCTPRRDDNDTDLHEGQALRVNRWRPDELSSDWVVLDGGSFLMGTHSHEGYPADREGPVREVDVASFAISKYTVTNAEFAQFADETGYVSDAERYGWSFVFHSLVRKKLAAKVTNVVQEVPWWWKIDGACWKYPEGPGSRIKNRMNHPVVHMSWNDAIAYADWAGLRLPTEVEWEYAARGGLVQKRYAWGDELTPDGKHMCNIWQGKFPDINTTEDGYFSTAPVDAFYPNGYGLYNVAGNVWEWCFDIFNGGSRAMRGGSYLCHESYCNRYRVAARSGNTPDSSSGNLGFRLVADV